MMEERNPQAIGKANSHKPSEVIINIGTISLCIPYTEAYTVPQLTPSSEAARQSEETQPRKPVTIPAPPLAGNATHGQQVIRKQDYAQRKRTSDAKAKTNTVTRFIKIPNPTLQWQKAKNKAKSQKTKRNSIQCFYCRRNGHTQRYCWDKIQCFQCGKFGHKCAKCLYKPTSPLPNPILKQKTSEIRKQDLNPDMDPIYGRPPLGQVFYPPRHALHEENDYLRRVGLIIFIRGFPSPDMPRLVAQTLAVAHGGRRTDYDIAEATIAPYLVTCRNTQHRDAVVQRGVYTNPQAQIQFAVHEWRPWFGMGYC